MSYFAGDSSILCLLSCVTLKTGAFGMIDDTVIQFLNGITYDLNTGLLTPSHKLTTVLLCLYCASASCLYFQVDLMRKILRHMPVSVQYSVLG